MAKNLTRQARAGLGRLLRGLRVYPAAKEAQLWLDRYNPSRRQGHQRKLDFFGRFIRPGDLCFDVGANTGDRTALFLELGARVVCLEPQPSVLEVLRKRFRKNPRVTIVEKGVGERPGVTELAICDDVTAIATFSEAWRTQGRFAQTHRWSRTHRVEITTLDTLIEQFGVPRLCKVDVEGFELEVLSGLSRPVQFTVFEFAREFMPRARACAARLLSIAPTEFNWSAGETMELALSRWTSAQELFETLEAIEDPMLWGDIVTRATHDAVDRSYPPV